MSKVLAQTVEEDTIYHALTQCTLARALWKSFKNMYGIKLPLLHPATWSQDILDNAFCSQEKSGSILCAMWALWTARNRRKHRETSISIYQACRWAWEMATDLIHSSPPLAYTLKMQMKKYGCRRGGFLPLPTKPPRKIT